MARGLVVASCLAIAPVAMANNVSSPSPEGANYLLSSMSDVHAGGGQYAGNIATANSPRDVPEPATWGIFGLGLAMIGFGAMARRRLVSND